MERITPVSEPDLAKLSEASGQCGIPHILKLMATDGLLPRSSGAKQDTCTFPATTSRPVKEAAAQPLPQPHMRSGRRRPVRGVVDCWCGTRAAHAVGGAVDALARGGIGGI
jgi:hypothetical protein